MIRAKVEYTVESAARRKAAPPRLIHITTENDVVNNRRHYEVTFAEQTVRVEEKDLCFDCIYRDGYRLPCKEHSSNLVLEKFLEDEKNEAVDDRPPSSGHGLNSCTNKNCVVCKSIYDALKNVDGSLNGRDRQLYDLGHSDALKSNADGFKRGFNEGWQEGVRSYSGSGVISSAGLAVDIARNCNVRTDSVEQFAKWLTDRYVIIERVRGDAPQFESPVDKK